MQILHRATPEALWHDIIHEAMNICDIHLHEDLESYLVFLMIRYSDRSDIVKNILALDFLESINLRTREREVVLREVGDKCLIFSGLFPKLAESRLVKTSYFVNLGRSSYANIVSNNTIYEELSHKFVSMMDILQSIRRYSNSYSDLSALQAFELWNETGSKRAYYVLKKYTNGVPVSFSNDEK